jgi:branched-subunit amino acid transport protein
MRFIILFLSVGIVTYIIRASFIFGERYFKKSPLFDKFIELIPVCVLPALIFPAVFINSTGFQIIANSPKIIASIAVIIISIYKKNLLISIITGMTVFYIIKAVL